ncbi:MAG: hypothetical protein SGBAC_001291 [Bacillariaceae sp.]
MPQSQSIVVLSSSCSGNELPSNDATSSPPPPPSSSSSSNPSSSLLHLKSLPLVCDILMLPELPSDEEPASLSQKQLNPCGIENVIWMQNMQQTGAMLMSLTSCHVVAAVDDNEMTVVLPVQPVPSTFVIDGGGETKSTVDQQVSNLNVAFDFEMAEQLWDELLLKDATANASVTTAPHQAKENHIREAEVKDSSKPTKKNDSSDAAQVGCDLTLEPFYQDLIRSSFQQQQQQPTKRSFAPSDSPEVVLKHLQMMTEKEAQVLDRILIVLGAVGVFLLGLLWWSGREVFRASRKESFQSKRIQLVIQEIQQNVDGQKARCCNDASPTIVPKPTDSATHSSKSTRPGALSFATPPPQEIEIGDNPPCSLPAPPPLPKVTHDDSIYDALPTVRLPQEQEEPFQVHGVSPVQKIAPCDRQQGKKPQVQLEEEEEIQGNESDEESSPVLLLLTTSLSINRKHVVHQERMKTLLKDSIDGEKVEIVDGADPSKKALRNALFQLSGIRAVYPQLFASRGSKLRFVGDMEKVQRLQDERVLTEEYLFNCASNNKDWQLLEDIICSASDIDQSFSSHENSVSSSSCTDVEDQSHLRSSSFPTLESQSSMTSVESNSRGKDFIDSAHSVSTPNQEPSSETNTITGCGRNVDSHDASSQESIHAAESVQAANQQPSLPLSEAERITSAGAESDANADEESIHSAVSVSTPRQPTTSSTASTPSSSSSNASNKSLSPLAKMAKDWEERRIGRGKSGGPIRSMLKPLALQWNTGKVLVSSIPPTDGIGQDTSPIELSLTTRSENHPVNRFKLTPTINHVSQGSTVVPAKTDDQETSLGSIDAPPSLEVTCSTPQSQDDTSFIDDYW